MPRGTRHSLTSSKMAETGFGIKMIDCVGTLTSLATRVGECRCSSTGALCCYPTPSGAVSNPQVTGLHEKRLSLQGHGHRWELVTGSTSGRPAMGPGDQETAQAARVEKQRFWPSSVQEPAQRFRAQARGGGPAVSPGRCCLLFLTGRPFFTETPRTERRAPSQGLKATKRNPYCFLRVW